MSKYCKQWEVNIFTVHIEFSTVGIFTFHYVTACGHHILLLLQYTVPVLDLKPLIFYMLVCELF